MSKHCPAQQATGGLCTTVDVFNGDTGAWTWTNLTRGRYEFAAASVGDAVVVAGGTSTFELRHHFGQFFVQFSALCAVWRVLLGAHANWVLIGAWNPML